MAYKVFNGDPRIRQAIIEELGNQWGELKLILNNDTFSTDFIVATNTHIINIIVDSHVHLSVSVKIPELTRLEIHKDRYMTTYFETWIFYAKEEIQVKYEFRENDLPALNELIRVVVNYNPKIKIKEN